MATDITKLPPQNIEAEQAILGAILLDSDALLQATDILSDTDFYKESHRLIYGAMRDVYELGGSELDIVSIVERLRQKGELEKAGGINYIATCANAAPTAANIRYHSKIVAQKALLRRIIAWTHENQKSCYEHSGDISELITRMESGIIGFAESVRERRSPDVSSILSDIQTRWQAEKDGAATYIDTDYKLNSVIPRYAKGHLWIIGGYTSVGKSTVLAQMISDIANNNGSALVFSLEDSREDKIIKLLSNETGISQRRLMTGNTDGLEAAIARGKQRISNWKLKVYDDIYTIDEIRLKIKKHKLRDGIDVVAIDYIQNIMGHGTLYERLSDGIVKLQKIAKEMQVTIIAVSQVSNEAMRSNSEVIGLKGAGELAAAADIVLWLKRHKDKSKETWLDCEVRKNRPYGTTGVIPLQFVNNWTAIDRRSPGRPAKYIEEEEDE